MIEQNQILEAQIREIYGRVVYTHKTHEKCADNFKLRSDILKYAEIILSAITTTSILFVLFGDNKTYQIIAALSSTCLLALTLYSKDFNLLVISQKHKQAALDILGIREGLLSLLIDISIGNKDIVELQKERDRLNNKLLSIYKGAPITNNTAYQKASKALKENEEFTFSEEELDKFLPETLRNKLK